MKPFEQLTFRGRMSRIRQLAKSALVDFSLSAPKLKFLRHAGNTLFRVKEYYPSFTSKPDVYTPGQYLLRFHPSNYRSISSIEWELRYLYSMCKQSDIPVPEPIMTVDDYLYSWGFFPGTSQRFSVSLLRWVKGRELKREDIRPHHYKALGELTAKLHDHSAHWKVPNTYKIRNYDWNGLFLQEGEGGELTREAWSLLPPDYAAPFEEIAQRVKKVMDQMGKTPDVYGLIHGDLGMGANVIFWYDDPRVIDFDDSGFGYYLYDLAIILEDSQDHQIQPQFREALLEGYTRVRSLTDADLNHLDLFLAAYAVFWCLFAVDAVHFHPEDRVEIYKRVERYYRLVQHFLANH